MMKISEGKMFLLFVKSKVQYFMYQTLFIAVIMAFFILFQLENRVLILFLIFCLVGNVLYILFEYFPRKKYYQQLLSSLESMDNKEFVLDVISEPPFFEGNLTHQSLGILSDYAKDKMEALDHQAVLQQNYIDTWMHEIKTPIACLKMIAANADVETGRKMNIELERTERYLEQVLYFSKVETANDDYLIRQVSLEKIMNEALKINSYYLIQNHATIEKDHVDVVVYTDEKWLQFIMSQIVINAVKYKKDDVIIKFSTQMMDDAVILSITDFGIGISKTDIKKVFNKGYTGKNGHAVGSSTGIGLYLCQVLAEKLYLGITINSEVNAYTTVKLTIPLNKKIIDRKEEKGYM